MLLILSPNRHCPCRMEDVWGFCGYERVRVVDRLAQHQPFSTSKRAQRSNLLKSPQITQFSFLSSLVNAQWLQKYGPGSAALPCAAWPSPLLLPEHLTPRVSGTFHTHLCQEAGTRARKPTAAGAQPHSEACSNLLTAQLNTA